MVVGVVGVVLVEGENNMRVDVFTVIVLLQWHFSLGQKTLGGADFNRMNLWDLVFVGKLFDQRDSNL